MKEKEVRQDDDIPLSRKILTLRRIPKITTAPTPFLVILLVIASFLLGMLTTKVQYLERELKGTKTTQATGPLPDAGVAGATAPQAPLPERVNVAVGHLPIEGDKDAKVRVIEFSDFQCPFCKNMYNETIKQLRKDYLGNGKVAFAFRHFPLSFHQNAYKAAEASECANDQGKFWEYHDVLFENQDAWATQPTDTATQTFTTYATQIGLDTTDFSTCLTSGKHKTRIDEDIIEGQKAGVSGTPATFINGKLVSGAVPYATFKTLIEEELKK